MDTYIKNTVVEYRIITALAKRGATIIMKVVNPRYIPLPASVININGDPYIVVAVSVAIADPKQPLGGGAINTHTNEYIYIDVTKANN